MKIEKLPDPAPFLEALGYDEEPMGMFFTDREPPGGWDPSDRAFLKTDELTFTVPRDLYQLMLSRWESSFLTTNTWKTVRKKIARSRKAWGEEA
jgi:hypothetical protein